MNSGYTIEINNVQISKVQRQINKVQRQISKVQLYNVKCTQLELEVDDAGPRARGAARQSLALCDCWKQLLHTCR